MVQDSVITANDNSASSFSYTEIELQPGLSVGLTRCTEPLPEPTSFDGDEDSLHFNYLIDGNFAASLGDTDINLSKGTINRGFAAGREFRLDQCRSFTNLEVMVKPDVFLSLSGSEAADLESVVLAGDFFVQACKACHRSTSAAVQIAGLLSDAPDQRLLLHSATLEYLHWHLQQFAGQQDGVRISMRERKQLEQAREILLADLSHPPTIPELARQVGLNQFKLKQGYRRLFGNSIYASFQEARMKQALVLLQKLNVTETALELGYSNTSHFSSAFRKQHGISPRDARHDRHICISTDLT